MTMPLLLALPWLGLILFEMFVARIPSELPSAPAGLRALPRDREPDADRAEGKIDPAVPLVSVVVPARNEALNIVGCLRSIAQSEYPEFEIIVVDDRSEDDTATLAREVPLGRARRIEVVEGAELPAGWLGKPWACHQGAQHARGEYLLFTDADTRHGPDLIGRAKAGAQEEEADLMTVVGRQLMETLWERLVQPHIFFLMLLRFPDFERVARNDNWRDAIANGQFLFFTRAAYEAIEGHVSVKDEVVEDLALAQRIKRAGLNLRIRSAEKSLATRMYRSLAHLVEGWSKNIVMGGLQSFPVLMRPVVPAASFVGGVWLWLVAPAVIVLTGVGVVDAGSPPGRDVFVWAVATYALSVVLWAHFSRRMGVSGWHGLLYPLGAAVGSYIFLKSWIRGRTVEWKGRTYRIRPASERL
ncbi:MAG: glycosyltransferase family 2 protein [Gemmatimonadota bacterium]|nr:glycosyltransferase family 2 protein [Gemmatimonadota bacterium]